MVRLTVDESDLVQESFGRVSHRMKQDGSQMFINLFTKYPDYKGFFPEFLDVDNESLKRHPAMDAHIIRVITGMRLIIDCINDDHTFSKLTKRLCEFHHIRGVKKPVLEHFSVELKEYVAGIVKTPEQLSAWDKAINAIVYNLSFDDVNLQLY